MEQETLKLVFAGHVDHGKSTLIGRLFYDTDSLPDGKLEEIEEACRAEGRDLEFGYVMDHLREERSRGITIDTAQTFFSTDSRSYVIIDAPGHKEFLKNMITGASQAEAAVLICSVPGGVQEQSRRHAYMLSLLGLRQVMVVYNKMDLVDYDEPTCRRVQKEMEKFLERIGIRPGFSVPVSAKRGDNVATRSDRMSWHDGPTILEALDRFEKTDRPLARPVRFPIQDVYTVDDRPVAVGRVESGVLERGAELHFLPGGISATVREIVKYREDDIDRAEAGECIGVVLEEAGPGRGEVGAEPGNQPGLSEAFRSSVFWLSPEPLKQGQDLTIRCSTQERPCSVAEVRTRIDSSTLELVEEEDAEGEPGTVLAETEVADVTLKVSPAMVVERFQDVPELGRFVLQRDGEVVAGGIVTSPE